MKTKQLLFTYAGTPVDDLPEELRVKLEKDPALRQAFESQAQVATLIKLKTYEQPEPAMEGRVLHRVGVRIQNGEHLRSEPMLEALPDWARMVAVVAVMLGLSLLTHREMMEAPDPMTGNATVVANIEPVEIDVDKPMFIEDGPFAPMLLTQEIYGDGEYLSPELSSQLEASILELGIDLTDFNQSANAMPVSYSLMRQP